MESLDGTLGQEEKSEGDVVKVTLTHSSGDKFWVLDGCSSHLLSPSGYREFSRYKVLKVIVGGVNY